MAQNLQQFSTDMKELYTVWIVSEICKDSEKFEMAERQEKKFQTYSKLYDKQPLGDGILLLTGPSIAVSAGLGAGGIWPIEVPIIFASIVGSLLGWSAYFGNKESKKDKVLEISYQQAYPKTIHIYPPDVHQVFTLLEKDLQRIGVSSGYSFRDPNIYGAFSNELEKFLESESADFGLNANLFNKYSDSKIPDYSIGPNVDYFIGPSRFLRSMRKFEEEFVKIAGKDGSNFISQKVIEYSNLDQKELYRKAREIQN